MISKLIRSVVLFGLGFVGTTGLAALSCGKKAACEHERPHAGIAESHNFDTVGQGTSHR